MEGGCSALCIVVACVPPGKIASHNNTHEKGILAESSNKSRFFTINPANADKSEGADENEEKMEFGAIWTMME